MIILRPITITSSILDSTTVTNTETQWSGATTYNANDIVYIDADTPELYISVVGSNLNHDPETDDGTWWTVYDLSANPWKMFSQKVGDQSVGSGSITVDITPGEIVNGLAFFNVDADSVSIVVDDPTDGEVYNQTVTLSDSTEINSWYEWFFEEIIPIRDGVKLDLPPYPSATITVTFTVSTGNAKVGALVLGSQKELGKTLWGSSFGVNDYSTKAEDSFGNFSVVQGSYAKRAEFDVSLETKQVKRIQTILTNYRATPAVWVGSEDYEPLIVYGYYSDTDVIMSSLVYSDISIDVRGIT